MTLCQKYHKFRLLSIFADDCQAVPLTFVFKNRLKLHRYDHLAEW